jgi:carbonic anhydrase
MSVIDEALSANATIANNYDRSRAKPPKPRIAIVTCMDPRLTNIGQMLGLADPDVDMFRNFGTVIDDDAVRSLVLSTRLLGSREIMIINHTDCGMLKFSDSEVEDRLRKETGQAPVAPARFYSFTDVEMNTREQVQKARSHPWIPQDVPVRGFVYDVNTGRLSEVLPRTAASARAARDRGGDHPGLHERDLGDHVHGRVHDRCRPESDVSVSAFPSHVR